VGGKARGEEGGREGGRDDRQILKVGAPFLSSAEAAGRWQGREDEAGGEREEEEGPWASHGECPTGGEEAAGEVEEEEEEEGEAATGRR
jgi:hypothetical protein